MALGKMTVALAVAYAMAKLVCCWTTTDHMKNRGHVGPADAIAILPRRGTLPMRLRRDDGAVMTE
ncbi:hypothetical protein BN1708_016241 [Verticillium longisporum]|uniref:Secreted protein n=1 Tax=Verticillium longisporum TaxID=100787 RepID=A0A0G4MGS7_VERLO|nr:hypothetical protein BN1708_016241 [Verticillium longisporum]